MTWWSRWTVCNVVACATDHQSHENHPCWVRSCIMTFQQRRSILQPVKKGRQITQAVLPDMYVPTVLLWTIDWYLRQKTTGNGYQKHGQSLRTDIYSKGYNGHLNTRIGHTRSGKESFGAINAQWRRVIQGSKCGYFHIHLKCGFELYGTKMNRERDFLAGKGLFLGQELWNPLPANCQIGQ